jgi:hypothetical protein
MAESQLASTGAGELPVPTRNSASVGMTYSRGSMPSTSILPGSPGPPIALIVSFGGFRR